MSILHKKMMQVVLVKELDIQDIVTLKKYDKKVVVDSVSFSIPKGKVTSFIGPNGAGKSTVMGMISRLIANDAGIIEFQGKSMHDWKSKELAKHLAILTQSNNIQMKLTVEELVAFGRFPHSGGRLAYIAMVIAQDTEFILLDEPTNNLDIYHATNLMKIIRKLSDELGKTVVTVLHEINYAAFYSDYICAFKDGRVAKFGTVDEVMTKEVLSEIYNVDFEIMNIQGRPLSIYY